MTFKTSFEFEDSLKLRHLQGRKISEKKNPLTSRKGSCMKVLSKFLGKQKYTSGDQVSRWAIFVFMLFLTVKEIGDVLICFRLSVEYEFYSCDTNCICLIWFFQMLLLQSSRRILKVNSITIIDSLLWGENAFLYKVTWLIAVCKSNKLILSISVKR